MAIMEHFRLFIQGMTGEDSTNPSNALLMGIGNSTTRAKSAVSDKNFLSFYLENTSTGTSNRGMYLREYLSGTGSGGEALRVFTSVQNVAGTTAHGAHISLNFGTTGSLTGLGVAARNTLHLNTSGSAAGTIAATQAEIYCDGSASDPAGATEVAFLRVVADGHADGIADLEDDAFFFSAQGFTDAEGNLLRVAPPTTLAASLRCKVGSTTYYLPLYSAQS